MVANIIVFAVAYLLFHFQPGQEVDPSISDALGPIDIPVFRVSGCGHTATVPQCEGCRSYECCVF